MSVDLLGMDLRNPLLLASGILGETGPSLLSVLDGGAAAVVTKSICELAREGHPNPTVVTLGHSMMNAMGLPNPGMEAFAEELEWLNERADARVIVSVFGSDALEYARVAERLAPLASAVELNLSCPHAKGYGAEIGSDPDLVRQVVGAVTDVVDVPVMAKLTPNTSDIVSLAKAAEEGGAAGLVAINTLKGMVVDVEMGAPALANTYGGLSGEGVRAVGVRCVHEIASSVDLPVVGVGGVSTAQDALEYLMAGATAVQVGTAIRSNGPNVFDKIARDLQEWLGSHGHSSISQVQGLLLRGGGR
ncbi:MAG: dihydroorotate dehydrogenase [Thermoplasmata archaeon]|nr:MAG: dihydroorotate dehydrogenase [Thermoplasmata archaeon]